jgi:hypothetical protein
MLIDIAWIAANATEGYHQNSHGLSVLPPSDGQFPRIMEAFATVLETLRIRRDPVSGVNRTLIRVGTTSPPNRCWMACRSP